MHGRVAAAPSGNGMKTMTSVGPPSGGGCNMPSSNCSPNCSIDGSNSIECGGSDSGGAGGDGGGGGGSGTTQNPTNFGGGYCNMPANPATGQSNCGNNNGCVTLPSGQTYCPGQVATLPNNPGTHCHDSISGAAENVPTSTSDYGHQVNEIDTVSATINVVGGYGSTATGPMGYIYVDNNGQWYLGESPSYTGNVWQVLGSQYGFIGALLTGEQEYGKNFDQPITPAQVQQMKGVHNGETIGVVPCVVPKANG